ncbi:MAG: hypothetical protein A2Y33_14745 [Spirochaetes bacterium GWF1_51_8]|nr:MAG: hypothetical protein A2Y33_14745 [Spirochaetes bacterium GWF1_51_8]
MLMPDEYPGGSLPSGLVAVNPSGALVVNISSSNVTGAGPFNIEADTEAVPPLKAGDFVVNAVDGKTYRLISTTKSGEKMTLKASEIDQSSPYELMFMKFKGTVEEIMAKFSPDSETRAKALTLNLFSYYYDDYIINDASFKLRLRNNTSIDLILDGNAEVGWFWAGGWVEIKLQLTGNFSLEAQMLAKKTWGTEKMLANPSQLFWLGPIPFQVSMPVYIGVEATVQALGEFKTGFNIVAGAGARFGAQIGWPTKAFFTPIAYCDIVSTPFEASFEGSVTVTPYLSIRPTLSVAWILHAGVDVRAYIEGVVAGKVTFKPGLMTGNVSLDLNVGLKGNGFVALGVDWLGLYQKWDMGTLFHWKHNLYHWGWDASMEHPASLSTPQNFNANVNPDGSVGLSWSPVNLAAGYYVYKKVAGNLVDRYFTKELSYLDKLKLTNGFAYTYTVSAVNGVVESPQSLSQVETITPLAAPGGFALTSNPSGSIGLSWSPVNGALQYKITRTATGGVPAKTIFTSATSIIDTALTTNVLYSYYVQSMNYAGEGTPTATKTTNAPLCAAPEGLMINSLSTRIVGLKWNSSVGATCYLLVRENTNTHVKKYFFTTGTTFDDETIEYDSYYIYKVCAKNYIGYGNYSTQLPLKTASANDPQVILTSPSMNEVFLCYSTYGWTGQITLAGKAVTGSFLPVDRVYYKVDSDAYQTAVACGATNFSITYYRNISEGNHTFYMYCVDFQNKTSLTNIIPFSMGKIKYLYSFGSSGSGNGQFDYPTAMDIDELGYLYILDGCSVQKINTNGNFTLRIGSEGTNNGQLGTKTGSYAEDLACNLGDGTLCVADSANYRVQAFNPSTGAYMRKFGEEGTPSSTNALAMSWLNSIASINTGGDYNKVYLLRIAAPIMQVKKFNTYGSFFGQWGAFGSGSGQFSYDSTIAYSDNYLYLSDPYNYRIQKLQITGAFVYSIGSSGTGNGQFNTPAKIDVDGTYIYVTDSGNNRIQVFDKNSGSYYWKFGSFGSGTSQFNYPQDIVVNGNFIYVLDSGNDRVQVFQKSF